MDELKHQMITLEPFVLSLLANPVTKLWCEPSQFKTVKGVLDARIHLKNTYGYSEWKDGQDEFETATAGGDVDDIKPYLVEIERDRQVYQKYNLNGTILDVGGTLGLIREFCAHDVQFVSVDPFINIIHESNSTRKKVYKCLEKPLNFIASMAEFLPFVTESFDWVHMRSMLDHVQVVDLALLEANRVLKPNGKILIGLYVEGGKTGTLSLKQSTKQIVKNGLCRIGIDKYRDHHIWHPTFEQLMKLVEDNGFVVEDTFWQPYYIDQVCYVLAKKIR